MNRGGRVVVHVVQVAFQVLIESSAVPPEVGVLPARSDEAAAGHPVLAIGLRARDGHEGQASRKERKGRVADTRESLRHGSLLFRSATVLSPTRRSSIRGSRPRPDSGGGRDPSILAVAPLTTRYPADRR